jgi:hypothetical protein
MNFNGFCGFYYLTNGHLFSVTNSKFDNLKSDVQNLVDTNIKISVEVDVKNNNIIWYVQDKIILILKDDKNHKIEKNKKNKKSKYDIFDLNKNDWYFNIGLDLTYDMQGEKRANSFKEWKDDSYIIETSFDMKF